MKVIVRTFLILNLLFVTGVYSQALRIPDTTNISATVGRKLGTTQIEVFYNSPSVRGREGHIWNTDIVPFDFTVLGFGSEVASPWRAGADESTRITFSTDVMINGEKLPAGSYGFFIAVYQDSCTLIFNSNTQGWGSYFYNEDLDILRVTTVQEKNIDPMKDRLEYRFYDQTEDSVILALEWENWRIPFTVSIDAVGSLLADIQKQLSGAIGFDPASLIAGANWCLTHEVNYPQALQWINSATSPSLGGQNTFRALSIKAGLLEKSGRQDKASQIRREALDNATIIEMHQYGRQLLSSGKKEEALAIFEKNYKTHKGAWPTEVGMMRVESVRADYTKALKYASKALEKAPDEGNKKAIEQMIIQLREGKAIH